MPDRVVYLQLKTGYNTDLGPSWIARVQFSRTFQSLKFQGKTLERFQGGRDANFYDVDNGDEYWVSGPKRDRSDGRYHANVQPTVEEDAREAYEAFLDGAPLPGRENG